MNGEKSINWDKYPESELTAKIIGCIQPEDVHFTSYQLSGSLQNANRFID